MGNFYGGDVAQFLVGGGLNAIRGGMDMDPIRTFDPDYSPVLGVIEDAGVNGIKLLTESTKLATGRDDPVTTDKFGASLKRTVGGLGRLSGIQATPAADHLTTWLVALARHDSNRRSALYDATSPSASDNQREKGRTAVQQMISEGMEPTDIRILMNTERKMRMERQENESDKTFFQRQQVGFRNSAFRGRMRRLNALIKEAEEAGAEAEAEDTRSGAAVEAGG
jgi:hypothetical protein